MSRDFCLWTLQQLAPSPFSAHLQIGFLQEDEKCTVHIFNSVSFKDGFLDRIFLHTFKGIVLLVLLQRNCNPKTSQNLKMIYQPSLRIWVSQKLFATSPRNGGFPKIKMQIAAL